MIKKTISIFILFVCLLSPPMLAQVTIGSGEVPLIGSLLQLKESESTDGGKNATKGLGMPRVKLTNRNALYPMYETAIGSGIANSEYNTPALKTFQDDDHIGLMVYHVENCLLDGAGLYIWSGTDWLILGDETVSLWGMVKKLGTVQDQIAPNGVAWHKDHEGNIFFSMNYDATNATGSNKRWMTTNLATKTYAPRTASTSWGTGGQPALTNSYASNSASAYSDAHWGYPNPSGTTDAALATTYNARTRLGLLYNYAAANGNQNTVAGNQGGTSHVGVQGICPTGWHLPTDLEWTELETEIKAHASKYSALADGTTNAGFAMMDVCESNTAQNSSNSVLNGGFSALLAGHVITNSYGFGTGAYFWTSSNTSPLHFAWYRTMKTGQNTLEAANYFGDYMFSVRCKKD